ncbi:hypothetical protein [Parasitella parasitica]|uniref:Uncharacterized protein n=1 Tax=Parasitella parasitica TaxID=35722 RepID=A0A0B7N8X9_9FUNG|nr:hypothetical protein [Parasitella parasitica]
MDQRYHVQSRRGNPFQSAFYPICSEYQGGRERKYHSKCQETCKLEFETNTFENFYYRPTAAASTSTQITNSIFSTENLITLGAEAEETEIIVGTTNNQDVSEAEASNVIV